MKIPDAVIKAKDLELVDFMDYVQTVINAGLYETRIFTAVPTWPANEGESAVYVNGTVSNDLYYFIGGAWNRIGFNLLGSLSLFDSNGDTGITPEYTTNEDVLRFFIAGNNLYSFGTFGFFIQGSYTLNFRSIDTHMFSSTAGCLTFVAGTSIDFQSEKVTIRAGKKLVFDA